MITLDDFVQSTRNKWVLMGICAGSVILIIVVFTTLSKNGSDSMDPISKGVVNVISAPTPRTAPKITDTTPTPNVTQTPAKAKEIADAIARQSKVDSDYAQSQKDLSLSYPWRKKMPLVGKHYYVYFNLDTREFIGLLYPTGNDNPDGMKGEIIKRLQDIGVKTEAFTFKWSISR
jgi:hypothetical protein